MLDCAAKCCAAELVSKIPSIVNFYMDDSGTRHPDRKPGRRPAHGHDYFALGGVLIDEPDEERARGQYDTFCRKWKIESPLHSSEIRAKRNNFAWIGTLPSKEQERFYEELFQLMARMNVLGLACVIDRPGYNSRYKEKYRSDRWLMCKTAFCIAVERASKYAINQGAKLRVLPERSSKKDDRVLNQYYEALRDSGSPFDPDRAGSYSPLDASQYKATLRELRFKSKSSPLVQIADLFLWPMAMGGYDASNRPYARLCEEEKLIDHACSKVEVEGIKYSCFELVTRKD